MARQRDSAAEYERRIEIARARLGPDATPSDVTALARGRAASTGITSSTIRDLERNVAGQPVKVVTYTDREDRSHVIVVTKNAKGKSQTHDLKVDKSTARRLSRQIDRIAKDLDIEPY
jgi:hypothetical protein